MAGLGPLHQGGESAPVALTAQFGTLVRDTALPGLLALALWLGNPAPGSIKYDGAASGSLAV